MYFNKATKGQQKILLTQLKEAVWMRDVAEQNLAKVERDKEELESRFMAAILEVQQKANLKQLVLEKKLETLQESLQSKELQLKQILSVSSNSHADVGTRSSGDDETGVMMTLSVFGQHHMTMTNVICILVICERETEANDRQDEL